MIYWTGWGIWIFVIAMLDIFVLTGIMIAYVDPIKELLPIPTMSGDRFSAIFLAMWLLLSAVTTYPLVWHRARSGIEATDPQTGRKHLVPHDDSFMFIRMKYWPTIFLVLAVVAFIASFFVSAESG